MHDRNKIIENLRVFNGVEYDTEEIVTNSSYDEISGILNYRDWRNVKYDLFYDNQDILCFLPFDAFKFLTPVVITAELNGDLQDLVVIDTFYACLDKNGDNSTGRVNCYSEEQKGVVISFLEYLRSSDYPPDDLEGIIGLFRT